MLSLYSLTAETVTPAFLSTIEAKVLQNGFCAVEPSTTGTCGCLVMASSTIDAIALNKLQAGVHAGASDGPALPIACQRW